MIDHISLRVQDFSRALDFYKAALAPLGYRVLMEFPNAAGLGADNKADLWIMQSGPEQPPTPTHIAISGERRQIQAFHLAALDSGGTDNGPPGLRLDYHPNYYAAFVHDPEGNNIEVVSHAPEGASAPKKAAVKTAAKKPAKKAAKPAMKMSAKGAKKSAAKKPPMKKAPMTKAMKTSAKAAKPAKKKRR
jgi:catechol 2,3-dioxygenase-like lactoylglutathione lyase family enzyme